MSDPLNSELRDGGAEKSPFGGLGQRVMEWLRGRREAETLRESLEEIIEESDDADLSIRPEKRQMLENLLKISDLRVDDVMVPRADIVALDLDSTIEDAIKLFHDGGHSRMPVYRGRLDDAVGFLHVKDLLPYWGQTGVVDLQKAIQEILFVPPSMSVLDLLLKMQQSRVNMAVVVDEYGGIDGLLTMEDLVEEIVGDIEDKDDESPEIIQYADGLIEADAKAPISELEEILSIDLLPQDQDEEVDSLGGLVTLLAGHLPVRGELVHHHRGVQFEIMDADPRRVKRLRIKRINLTASPEEAED